MWKYIENTNNLYQINENGDVKSLPRTVKCKRGYRTTKEIIMKHTKTKTGYHQVGLHTGNKYIHCYIHILVAKAFVENDDPIHKNVVDHIDGNIDNNTSLNLRWCSTPDNNNFELHRTRLSNAKKGNKPKNFCFIKPIQQIDMKTGEIIAEYSSGIEASKSTGVLPSAISAAATHKKCTKNGYTWYTQSAGGYYWRFI